MKRKSIEIVKIEEESFSGDIVNKKTKKNVNDSERNKITQYFHVGINDSVNKLTKTESHQQVGKLVTCEKENGHVVIDLVSDEEEDKKIGCSSVLVNFRESRNDSENIHVTKEFEKNKMKQKPENSVSSLNIDSYESSDSDSVDSGILKGVSIAQRAVGIYGECRFY